MDTNVNGGNSGASTVGTQTTASNPDEINDALCQLRTTVSDFVQEIQATIESLIALATQASQQFRTTDSNVRQNTAQIERLSGWIANNRR